MRKESIIIMIISLLSKVLGFLRETFLAYFFGSSSISDAFVYSFNLPNTIFTMVLSAITAGFIPTFTRIESREGKEKSNLFLNNVINSVLILAVMVSLIIFFFTRSVLGILVRNASESLLVYLVPFIKVTSFSIGFTCIIQILTGYHQIRGSFYIPALVGFPMNIIVIAGMYISQHFGSYMLPYFTLLAYFVQALLIYMTSLKLGFKPKAYINSKEKNMHHMIFLIVPLIISSATMSIGGLVNQNIASGVEGAITQLNYSARIGGLFEAVFGAAIVSVLFPSLSKAIADNDYEAAKKEFKDSLLSIFLLILPTAIGLFLLAQPVISLAFQRGQFGLKEVLSLTSVLKNYCFGIIFFSLHNLFVKVFYSFQDMKTPMKTSILIIATQIPLAYLLFNIMGVSGITLARSISYILVVTIEFYLASRKFPNFSIRELVKEMLKIVVSAFVMGLVVILMKSLLEGKVGRIVFLALIVLVAVIVYFILVMVLKVDVVINLLHSAISKIENKKKER